MGREIRYAQLSGEGFGAPGVKKLRYGGKDHMRETTNFISMFWWLNQVG